MAHEVLWVFKGHYGVIYLAEIYKLIALKGITRTQWGAIIILKNLVS